MQQLMAVGESDRASTRAGHRNATGSRCVAPSQRARAASLAPTLALLVIGAFWGLFYLWHGQFLHRADSWEETAIGTHLALGHGFASPFDRSPEAPPTSWSPPFYPLLIAGVFRTLGVETPAAVAVLKVVNAACYGAVAAGIYLLARRLFTPAAGGCAAALFLAHPQFLRWTSYVWDMYVALAIFVWLAVLAVHLRGRRPQPLELAALGGGLGLLLLTNASYVLAAPLLALVATAGLRGRARLAGCAAAALGLAVVLAPWTIRNTVTFGHLFFVRGGASFELWHGNQPGSTGWLTSESFGRHPGTSRAERKRLLELGETRYFAECGERFRAAVHDDPAAFARRSGSRLAFLFLSDWGRRSYYPLMPDLYWRGYFVDRVLLNGALAALGLAGAWAAWRLGYRGAWVTGLGLLAVLPFVPSSVWDRQTLPLRAMLIVTAGFLLAAVIQRLSSGQWPTRRQHAAAARPPAPSLTPHYTDTDTATKTLTPQRPSGSVTGRV